MPDAPDDENASLLRYGVILFVVLAALLGVIVWHENLLEPFIGDPPPAPDTLEPKTVSVGDASLKFYYLDWERGFVLVHDASEIPPPNYATVLVRWDGQPRGAYYVANLFDMKDDGTVVAQPMSKKEVLASAQPALDGATVAEQVDISAQYVLSDIALHQAEKRRDVKRRKRKQKVRVEHVNRRGRLGGVDINKLKMLIPGN